MKKLFLWAEIVSMLFLPIAAAFAGPNDTPAIQNYESLNQDEQVIVPKAGISWREQVVKERTIMWRAAEMRNANKRNALTGKKERIEGVSVDAYNELIRERNAGLGLKK